MNLPESLDPLSAYLVRRYEWATTYEGRGQDQDALSSMGYWLLPRPVGYSEEEMRKVTGPTSLSNECRFIGEFLSKTLPMPGYEDDLEEIVAIYQEREQP